MKNLGCSLLLLAFLALWLGMGVCGQPGQPTMAPYTLPTHQPTTYNVPYWEYGLPKQQVAALEALYMSTNGPQWNTTGSDKKGMPWSFLKDGAGMYLIDPCQGDYPTDRSSITNSTEPPIGGRGYPWFGLTCSCGLSTISPPTKCYIRSIQLANSNLRGKLPTKLSDIIDPALTGNQIHHLDFSANFLTGNIPASFGILDPLFWKVSSNELSGTIPPELGNWSDTLNFFMDDNELTGSIHNALTQMSVLEELNLFSNQLTGTLPKDLARWQQVSL